MTYHPSWGLWGMRRRMDLISSKKDAQSQPRFDPLVARVKWRA